MESELIQVEFQAAILISDKNVDGVDAEVGILPVQANGSSACPGGDYKGLTYSSFDSSKASEVALITDHELTASFGRGSVTQ